MKRSADRRNLLENADASADFQALLSPLISTFALLNGIDCDGFCLGFLDTIEWLIWATSWKQESIDSGSLFPVISKLEFLIKVK